jgi:ABC-type sugar transport system permease subunit
MASVSAEKMGRTRVRKRYLNQRQQDTLTAWALISPAALVILAVVLYPIIRTLYLSTFNVSLSHPDERVFVFLGNYIKFLKSATFWETIRRTAYFTITSVALELVLGIFLAVLVNTQVRGWRFLRFSLIIPWAVPTIVNGTIWRWIYNADYGALNGLLLQFGLIDKYIPWLIDKWRAMNLVIVADVWHCVPFAALIIQAALATIPTELYEAAAIDGANAWEHFWRITLPLLRPAILVVLVVRMVEAFRVFDLIFIITRGGPAWGTVTISYLTYLETFSNLRIGSGAALSFLVSGFILIAAIVFVKLLYRDEMAKV